MDEHCRIFTDTTEKQKDSTWEGYKMNNPDRGKSQLERG